MFAEYSLEHGDSNKGKLAQSGFNRRTFNTVEVQRGDEARLSQADGVITLAPGLYHIVACSILTAVGSDSTHPGYCVLRHPNIDLPGPDTGGDVGARFLASGTIANAAMGTASMIDTYLEVSETTQIVVEHQVLMQEGQDVYLQLAANDSSNHVMARIRVEVVR